ncbi:MAG: DUF4411 family protein [Candidatus Micrarchaeia archaeon]
MSKITYYIIDTSSLIELNRKYPIDVFPGIWKKIEELIGKGFLFSPHEVRKEILVLDDSLKDWVQKQEKLFRPLTANQIELVRTILKKYPSLANPDSEVPSADPFVIALAVEMGKDPQQTLAPVTKIRIIVTEERLRGNRVRIPFVCKDYSIACLNILEMCRAEGWKFDVA